MLVMSRNLYLLFIILLFIIFGCNQKESSEQPPNILFIAVDDLRPELNCYGASYIKSPSIDKLASQSLVFERAYCNIPVCGASRASLMSGIRPGKYRFIGYNTRLEEDYPGITSLPKQFKDHGYC